MPIIDDMAVEVSIQWRARGGAAVDLFDDLDNYVTISIIAVIVLALVVCVVVMSAGGLLEGVV